MNVKEVWTDSDFDSMDWHDSYIHSITFPYNENKFTLDIDYLFAWELDKVKNTYNFWISPCWLTFLSISNLRIEIDFANSVGLEILDIRKLNSRISLNGKVNIWNYQIETDKGIITFEALGFIQKVKVQPVFTTSQLLPREAF